MLSLIIFHLLSLVKSNRLSAVFFFKEQQCRERTTIYLSSPVNKQHIEFNHLILGHFLCNLSRL